MYFPLTTDKRSMTDKLKHLTSTLRGKLSLWYLTSVALIIIIFLAAASVLFWYTLKDQIDHHVHIAVNEAREIVQNYKGDERDELLKNLVSAQGMTIIVLSPDGAPVLETNSPDVAAVTEHELQQILTSTNLRDPQPAHFTENNIRFAAMPIQISAGKGILAVGYSTQVLYATFNRMLLIVGGVVLLLVLPITFLGYRLLKHQLKPLESIADQAKRINDRETLSKRIHINASTEELVTIQSALNFMLTQLERIFSSERQFFSDAAHTLKTPLAVLRSQVENSTVSHKMKQEQLSTIDAASDTIQDLLFLSKVGNKSQEIETFSLSSLMENLVELATTLGEEKQLQVTSTIQKGVEFRAEKKLLQRALSNIAHNAVLYNRSQGSINFELKEHADKITIKISDTGRGIKKRDQSKVFTRFFRGEHSFAKGSGLGLAITKAVIEDLGGQIHLDSEINKGTTIKIRLSSTSA